MTRIPITSWAQQIIKTLQPTPSLCVDATCGTGKDTIFLCELCDSEGKVVAFDIQEDAVCMTRERVQKAGYSNKVNVYLESHEKMDEYISEESADLIMFNLGYLPGGDHQIATKAKSSIVAIEKSLKLLKKGGVISILIYSGGDSGFEEKDAVLAFLKTIDPKQFTVIVDQFYNKPNNPPIPVFIIK